jgi:rRNA maturation protein Nop10
MGMGETAGTDKTFAEDFPRCGNIPENPMPDRFNKNPQIVATD